MSEYTKHLARQLGIRETAIKPVDMDAMDVDPEELEMGMKDETEHTDDPALAKKIALHHLKKHGDYYSKLNKAGLDEKVPSAIDRIMSPTAIAPQIIGVAVRGSNTGGLPSGADQTGISPQTPTGRLGGYEPIPPAKANSALVDKTPKNSTIDSDSPIAENPPVDSGCEHPHQTQHNADEPPQAVTGASEEGSEGPTLNQFTKDDADNNEEDMSLKSALPKGIDIDVAEGEDEENQADNPEFQDKDKEQFRKDRSDSPEGDEVRKKLGMAEGKFSTERLQEIRQSLSEKAALGKMNAKESEIFASITEVLSKRGLGLEQKLFGKKSMLETARVEVKKKLNEGQYSAEELESLWQNDKNGEYIQLADDGSVKYIAHQRAVETIAGPKTADSFRLIRTWFKNKGISLNIWHVNERGNIELFSPSGKSLGGLA